MEEGEALRGGELEAEIVDCSWPNVRSRGRICCARIRDQITPKEEPGEATNPEWDKNPIVRTPAVVGARPRNRNYRFSDDV